MLKIENLHKIYGKYHALSGLDMTVKDLSVPMERERRRRSRS